MKTAEEILNDKGSDYISVNACINAMHEFASQSRWISCEERLPEIIKGKNYSKNVLAWCDDELKVMCLCYVDSMDCSGYLWANCYGDINGDGEIDDEYFPTHWQLIEPPKQ